MEALCDVLSSDVLGQFTRNMFELANPEGPVLISVNTDYRYKASHPSRAAFLNDEPEVLRTICGRIEDGDDPCVLDVEGGCVIGTQLFTEQAHLGYFLIFLPGYQSDTVQVNMDMAELMLLQAQTICRLTEQSQQLYQTF